MKLGGYVMHPDVAKTIEDVWSGKLQSEATSLSSRYLAAIRSVKCKIANSLQFIQTKWSELSFAISEQCKGAANSASKLWSKANQETENAKLSVDNHFEAETGLRLPDEIKRYADNELPNSISRGPEIGDAVDPDQDLSGRSVEINHAFAEALEAELKFLAESEGGSTALKIFVRMSDTDPGKRKIILLNHGSPGLPLDPNRPWLGSVENTESFGNYFTESFGARAQQIKQILNMYAMKNEFQIEEVILLACHVPKNFAQKLQSEMGVRVLTLGEYHGSRGTTTLEVSKEKTFKYRYEFEDGRDPIILREGNLASILDGLHHGESNPEFDAGIVDDAFLPGDDSIRVTKRYGKPRQEEIREDAGHVHDTNRGRNDALDQSRQTRQERASAALESSLEERDPEAKKPEPSYHEFSSLEELRQDILIDSDPFNAEVDYNVLLSPDNRYRVVNIERINDMIRSGPTGHAGIVPEANEDKLWAAVGHLRWSDELDEHGDEKGWDLTILNAEPTRSLSAQEVTRQIARPLSTGHQEQTHPSILAEQEAAQAAGQAILAQQQAVGAGVPAQRLAPAAAAARTAAPPPPSVAPSPGLGKAASAAGSEPSVSDYASVIEADDRSGRPIRGFPQQLEPTTIAPGQVIGYRGLSRPATLAADPAARLAVVRACPLEKHLAETRPAKLPRARGAGVSKLELEALQRNGMRYDRVFGDGRNGLQFGRGIYSAEDLASAQGYADLPRSPPDGPGCVVVIRYTFSQP